MGVMIGTVQEWRTQLMVRTLELKRVLLKRICVTHVLFFFQAEDGIRDLTVTGVQTCALPISRDYTYVDDIVAGILASLDHEWKLPSDGAPFEVFNLGNSHPVKLTELIELLESVTGRKAICDWRPLQPGDSPVTWADTSKATCMLGYRPSTALEQGLTNFVRWYRRSVAPACAVASHTTAGVLRNAAC